MPLDGPYLVPWDSRTAKSATKKRRYRTAHGLCVVCRAPFVGTIQRIYCSEQCKKRAWWRKHRGKQENP
jgi:hypothetical protein